MINNLIHSILVCPEVDREYPIISHGEGIYIYDIDGKKYIDGTSGSAAVANLGHSIEGISDIVKKQIDRVAVIPTHTFRTAELESYLEKLIRFAPEGFTRAWTVLSGTEAVEQSLKLALQYHQLNNEPERYKIISRWGSYHGNSVFTLDVGGMKIRRGAYEQWLNNFPHTSPAYSYRRPEGVTEEDYGLQCAQELEMCILKNDPETIAAFIIEPVVGAALGAVPPPNGYMKEVRRICDKYGILFIADEVLTGFGRIGANFGIERFGVTPDIIATGKGISAGFTPLSAIIAHEKVAQVFEKYKAAFLGGHTFACNPVSAQVGSFVIDYIEENGIVENAKVMGEYFLSELKKLEKYPIVGDTRGMGLLLGIEFVMCKETKKPFPKELNLNKLVVNGAFERGVVIYPGKGSVDGVNGDHVLLSPPLIINKEEIDIMIRVLEATLIEVSEAVKSYSAVESVVAG